MTGQNVYFMRVVVVSGRWMQLSILILTGDGAPLLHPRLEEQQELCYQHRSVSMKSTTCNWSPFDAQTEQNTAYVPGPALMTARRLNR